MTNRPTLAALLAACLVTPLAACSGNRPSLVAPPTTLAAESPCAVPTFVEPAPDESLRPPEALEGEVWCYIRVPAVTQTISEKVMVAPPSCREEWVPPVTQEVTEEVVVKPEERRRVPVPAVIEDRVEKVMVCDAKTEWRKVECAPKALGQGEQVGECWTLVTIPAQYEDRVTRVVVKPETFREEVVPAVTAQQARTVVVSEGYMKKVDVPAVYDVRTREVEVSPARWEWRRTGECEVPAAAAMPDAALPPPSVVEAPPPAGALPEAPLPVEDPTPAPAPAPVDPGPAPAPVEPAPVPPAPAPVEPAPAEPAPAK